MTATNKKLVPSMPNPIGDCRPHGEFWGRVYHSIPKKRVTKVGRKRSPRMYQGHQLLNGERSINRVKAELHYAKGVDMWKTATGQQPKHLTRKTRQELYAYLDSDIDDGESKWTNLAQV